jgi:hypothetical protein
MFTSCRHPAARLGAVARHAYYSFRNVDTDKFEGLVCMNPAGVQRADSVQGWVDAPEFMRRLIDPGADGPELVERDVAEQLASRYRVAL